MGCAAEREASVWAASRVCLPVCAHAQADETKRPKTAKKLIGIPTYYRYRTTGPPLFPHRRHHYFVIVPHVVGCTCETGIYRIVLVPPARVDRLWGAIVSTMSGTRTNSLDQLPLLSKLQKCSCTHDALVTHGSLHVVQCAPDVTRRTACSRQCCSVQCCSSAVSPSRTLARTTLPHAHRMDLDTQLTTVKSSVDGYGRSALTASGLRRISLCDFCCSGFP